MNCDSQQISENRIVPPFSEIDHPTFPQWMIKGLDRLFTLDSRIDRICFYLWADSYNDDNASHELKGTASVRSDENIDEEVLDEIPPVRMFERRAHELWYFVPIKLDEFEDVSINGSFTFHAERGLILFEYETMDEIEHQMVIEARHDGEKWTYSDRIILTTHQGSASDLLAGDAQSVLATYSESDLLLDAMPEAIGVEVNEDEHVVVHLKPGELTRCMETR